MAVTVNEKRVLKTRGALHADCITCYPTYGGSGVVATELGMSWAALGHEVHFISYSQPFRLTGRDEASFIMRYRSQIIRSSSSLLTTWRLLRAWLSGGVSGLDLLHVHYAIHTR